jgi:RNA polymerase sigma-70 factor, ECF subfamily
MAAVFPDVSVATAGLASDAEVAQRIYERHYGDVFRYLRARVATHAEAEDLASDVFCKAVAAIGRYREMRPTALPWLYTIAAHRVADHYRSKRSIAQLEEAERIADPGPNPDDLAVTGELVRWVWTNSLALPPSQRRALWMRYGEQLELAEIAVRMGRSVQAVKLLVHRAIRAIRLSMQAAEAGIERSAPETKIPAPAAPRIAIAA